MNGRTMKFFATWLKTILIVFAIGLGSVPLISEAAPIYPATYPVIFIHGESIAPRGSASPFP